MNLVHEPRMQSAGIGLCARSGLLPVAPDEVIQAQALRHAAQLMRATKEDILRRVTRIRAAAGAMP